MSVKIFYQHKLKFLAFNVNSLVSHSKRVQLNFLIKRHRPDIVLLSETKLNAKHKPRFANYDFIRNDRLSNKGGGTGILIRSNIKYESVNTPHNLEKLEITLIKVHLNNNQSLYCGAIYQVAFSATDLENVLSLVEFNDVNQSFVLGGDWNCRHEQWFNVKNNPNGIKLKRWLDTNANRFKTRMLHSMVPTHDESFIDFFLVHQRLKVLFAPDHCGEYLEAFEPGISDHKSVELVVSLVPVSHQRCFVERAEPKTAFRYKSADWKMFKSDVNDSLSDLMIPSNRNLCKEEIDVSIAKLTDIIVDSMNRAIPKYTVGNFKQVELTPAVKSILNKKRSLSHKLDKAFITTGSKESRKCKRIKSEIKCLDVMSRNSISSLYQSDFRTRLTNIRNDNEMFSNIKSVLGCRSFERIPNVHVPYAALSTSTPISNIDTLLKVNDGADKVQICNDQDKANLLGNHYENIHKQNVNLGDKGFTDNVNDAIRDWVQSSSHGGSSPIREPIMTFTESTRADSDVTGYMHFVSPKRLKEIVKGLKNKKSSGFDQISNAVLRKLPPLAVKLMVVLFNNCLNISYFPEQWKIANIIPIRKPNKNPVELVSYRPISLLSNLGKLLEKIILGWIIFELEDKKLMSSCQFGFRRSHSTNHALLTMSEDIIQGLNDRKFTIAVFLDSEKAFDTVWITGLIWKMKFKFNMNDNLCFILYNYLRDRSFKVTVNGKISTPFKMLEGTPQGSIISPILYSIFTLDIPRHNDPKKPRLTQFADDTATYHSSRTLKSAAKRINEYLKEIADYYDLWKIRLNPSKSEAIIFREPSPRCGRNIIARERNIKIEINSVIVPKKRKVKYLGVYFNYLWKFSDHAKYIVEKTHGAKNLLYPILNSNSGIDPSIKLLCYKQLIRPIITYGFPTWFNAPKTRIEKIKTLERNCLRQCVNFIRTPDEYKYISNSELYSRSNVIPIDSHMFGLCEKFVGNLQFIENPLIERIVEGQNRFQYFDRCLQSKRYLPVSGLTYYIAKGLVWQNDSELRFYG